MTHEDVQRGLGRIEGTLASMQRFEEVEHEKIGTRFESLDQKIDRVDQKVENLNRWKIRVVAVVSSYVAVGLFAGQIVAKYLIK